MPPQCRTLKSELPFGNLPMNRLPSSVWVAGFPEDGVNQSELLARADEALYLSKKAGKNRVTRA